MERKWTHVMFAVGGIVLAWLLTKTGEWCWSYFGKPNSCRRRAPARSSSPAWRRSSCGVTSRCSPWPGSHDRAAQGHLAVPQGDVLFDDRGDRHDHHLARRSSACSTASGRGSPGRSTVEAIRRERYRWQTAGSYVGALHGDEVVRGPHVLGPREQGAALAPGAGQADGQGRPVRPDPHPDRVGARAGQGPAPHDHPQVLPGLHVRPDGAERGDLPPGQEHAQDHRLPRRPEPDPGQGVGDRAPSPPR